MSKFEKFLNCENCLTVKRGYVAGFNMPGYLPEAFPIVFDTLEDAKQSIIEEILNERDNAHEFQNNDIAFSLVRLANKVEAQKSEFTTDAVNGYCYWVAREEITQF